MRIRRVLVAALLFALTQPARGAVLCARRRSGVVFLREACTRKETRVPLEDLLPSDTADQVRGKFFTGTACPGNDSADVMVKVGSLCVDVYEASVWGTPTGGTRYGIDPDYPCGASGDDCPGIYARSVAGVVPSRWISWFQAAAACRNASKRLLTNAEWQMAAAGTPDPGEGGNGRTTCNTRSPAIVSTGSTGDCVSHLGTWDMVGNVYEWVGEWVPRTPIGTCPGWGAFSDDLMCLAGASTALPAPGGLYRGGNWVDGGLAGVFDVNDYDPSFQTDSIGFRCGR